MCQFRVRWTCGEPQTSAANYLIYMEISSASHPFQFSEAQPLVPLTTDCIFRKINAPASFVSARSSFLVNGRLDFLDVINLPQNRLPLSLINCCWFTFPCETYNLKSRFFPSNLSSIPLSRILPGNFRNYLPPNGSQRYVKTYGEIIFCSFTALGAVWI